MNSTLLIIFAHDNYDKFTNRGISCITSDDDIDDGDDNDDDEVKLYASYSSFLFVYQTGWMKRLLK